MLDSRTFRSQFVFVVFSDDWGRHPSSCQHLFRRILPQTEVIWVNTVGLRTPRLSLYDIRRAFQVIFSWMKPGKKPGTTPEMNTADARTAEKAPAPHVIRPIMWPSFRRGWSAALNHFLLTRAVRKALDAHAPGKEAVLISTLPIIPGLFRDPRFRKKVYYCVDDFTQWHGIDGDAMRRLEQRTLAGCDLMIATSTPILEARAGSVRASALLTHGVDAAHFSAAKPDPDSPLSRMRRPIVGMFGVFDRRVDGDALRASAQALPQATFVVLGPVVDREPGEFRDLDNLVFLGSLPYERLPRHVAHFDVCILPYVVDETTRSINPLKLKEYLATGKPVVSTPLPEAERLGAYLTLAEPAMFAQAVAAALDPSRIPPQGLDAYLHSESWDAKSERFLAEVLKGL